MTNISTLGQSLDQIARLKTMQTSLASLQYQLTSGKKTNLFKGLGTSVIASERARANVAEIDTYQQNITVTDRRIKMMINTIQSIDTQAGNVVNAIQIQTQQGEFEIESVGDLAGKARDYIISLLNERDGDRFLFGGADAMTKPLNDTGLTGSYMQTQINDWVNGNINTDDLIASYRERTQLTDTINGYSAALSSGNVKGVYVRVEESTEVNYTTLANNDGFRDILTAVGMLESLTKSLDRVTTGPADPPGTITAPGAGKKEQNDNFYRVFNDLALMINNGLDKIQAETFKLSQVQAKISQINEGYKIEKATLAEIIADVEDADINDVAVKLNALQVQLEASYRVTASISQLSLAYLL